VRHEEAVRPCGCERPARRQCSRAWTITVSGTIYADQAYGAPDQLGFFGAPGTSMLGAAYSMTITTDPSLNTY
jgi:hypothetical protein